VRIDTPLIDPALPDVVLTALAVMFLK